jgi:hypothetical protein
MLMQVNGPNMDVDYLMEAFLSAEYYQIDHVYGMTDSQGAWNDDFAAVIQ